MVKTELFTDVDIYTFTSNIKALLGDIKYIVALAFIVFTLLSLIDINYTLKTRKVLRKAREEFGDELTETYFTTLHYNLAETPKQVYTSLIEYLEDLREERGV